MRGARVKQEQEFLSDKEHDAYMEDLSEVVSGVIERMIAIADKHNVDRDNAMKHFSTIFSAMVEISTFRNWQGGE